MSNPLRKISRGIKKTFKAVAKTVKKVVKSKVFKIALVAAAVYFGGTALMAAYGGTAAAGGAAAGAAGTASTAGSTALSTGVMGTSTGAMGSAATTVGAGSISPMAAAGGTIGSGAAATTAASAISPMAAAGTATAGSSGILGSLTTGAKAVGSFAAKHPLITSQVINTGGQMLKGYAEGKALEDERKYQEKLRGQQTIAGVRYDGKGNTTPIDTYQSLNELNKQLFSGVYAQRLTPLYQERNQAQA